MPDSSGNIKARQLRGRAATERYIAMLTGAADSPMCWRLGRGKEWDKLKGTLAEWWDRLAQANAAGVNVFVVVNEGGQTDNEITRVRALYIDVDKVSLDSVTWHAQPHFIVWRNDLRWHAFWLVGADVTVEQFRECQQRLIEHYKSDPVIFNESHVMRVPGFAHVKDASNPLPVTLVDMTDGADPIALATDRAYSLAEVTAGLPRVSPRQQMKRDAYANREPRGGWNPAGAFDGFLAVLKECDPAIEDGECGPKKKSGDPWTYDVACLARDYALSADQCLEAMLTDYLLPGEREAQCWNERGLPPWDLNDLSEKIDHAYAYAQNPAGSRFSPSAVDEAMARASDDSATLSRAPKMLTYKAGDGTVFKWPEGLTRGCFHCSATTGLPKADFYNALLAARHMAATGAKAEFNEFSKRIVFRGAVPWCDKRNVALDDDTVRMVRDMWIREHELEQSRDNVNEALRTVAAENPFHPVRDYLDNLKWDGVERIDSWLVSYFGASDAPFVRAAGRKFLIGAVTRIFSPGCKFDTMLVQIGGQGQGKSRALRKLAVDDDWFSDRLPRDVSTPDAVQALQGLWIIEAAELQGMRSSDVASVKAFLSRSFDVARFAYGRETGRYPRQCVLVGTTNESDFLKDPTGNRRFWPVVVTRADHEAIERDRNQLWAEAVEAYRHGEEPVLPAELWDAATLVQEEHRPLDPWEELLRRYLDGARLGGAMTKPLDRVHAVTLLREALDVPPERMTRDTYARLRSIMGDRIGWTRRESLRIGAAVATGFVRPFELWEPGDE